MIEVWCGLKGAASWDPESLGLELLVAANKLEVPLVATNYTLEGRLPAMGKVRGYVEIVDELRAQGLLEYSEADVCGQFYAKNLTVLSLYLLFESHRNYEEVTRPTISNAVPFPMQYNLTLGLQKEAKERTAALLGEMPQQDQAEKAISKTHEKMLREAQDRRAAIKSSKRVAHVLQVLDRLYTELEGVVAGLGGAGSPAPAPTPAYCIIAANLLLHSLALPDPIFLPVLQNHPKLEKMAAWAAQTQREIPQENKYTLQNYLWHRLSSFSV